ncbi:hypothetical protein KC330_g114 [Hortaea werneckii]|nr:hypothetical protein KC330_g114 [Hortaea werneckii]
MLVQACLSGSTIDRWERYRSGSEILIPFGFRGKDYYLHTRVWMAQPSCYETFPAKQLRRLGRVSCTGRSDEGNLLDIALSLLDNPEWRRRSSYTERCFCITVNNAAITMASSESDKRQSTIPALAAPIGVSGAGR